MDKITKTLYDSGGWLSVCKSASLREENRDVEPTYFKWIRGDAGHEFVSDGEIRRILQYYKETGTKSSGSVAWLIEPRELHPENYEFDFSPFRAILTYDKELLEKYPDKARFYPLGGSSIALEKWGMQQKIPDKKVCMFISSKDTTEGHKLRHKIYETAQAGTWPIDFYGEGVGKPIENKFDILSEYLAVIVVESCKQDHYFSEKLIDALSMGCMVYYWGCPSIENYFRLNESIMPFNSIRGLGVDLGCCKISRYLRATEDIISNLELAKKYRISEDWIYENYSDLFSG